MRYLTFSKQENKTYKYCILVTDIRRDNIEKEYIIPFGLDREETIVISLFQSADKKKTPVKEMKQYIEEELNQVIQDMKIEYLLIADSEYFKVITKNPQADKMLGYAVESQYGKQTCFYLPNYLAVFYDPDKIKAKISIALQAFLAHVNGHYSDPGISIIEYSEYPLTVEEIRTWLIKLLEWNKPLSCDIEAFSLKHYSAGIGTITFCWSKTEGIAFPVDLLETQEEALEVHSMLKEFFELYNNTLIFHHISYDVTVLIYQLFMSHILDTEGLLNGINVLLKNWDDTKLISYLATNSCAGNKLGLKEQAQEYAGNYAVEDIKDIRLIPLPELLQYNLVDGLSTWYVYEKNYPIMVQDQQLDIYNNIFKPAIVDIIQMQLTGLPINMPRVKEVKRILQADCDKALASIHSSSLVQKFTYHLNEEWVRTKNEKLKKKRVTLADANVVFNPNSDDQLRELLYVQIGLPHVNYTDSKLESTDKETLKALKNRITDPEIISLLDALLDYTAVYKILTAFIPAFENACEGPDRWHYLFGNFNLGGTVSGRLSSNGPNLQNLPATASKYAKIIKSCFSAPSGWLFCGIDFSSLEDRISGLTTKDPNKLKVYTDGYDGHCLRALYYFREEIGDIDENDVKAVNNIEKTHKHLRQKGKNPTFALTYDGTWRTLVKNYNFSDSLAHQCEDRYKLLYQVSIQWVKERLDEASKVGYVVVAFGLRVRTPLLYQVIRGTSKTPFEAEAEGRTAGNALGQSWGLLNSRAGTEFMSKVRDSDYRLDIRPCAQIHDAQYYLVRDDINVIQYCNIHVVKACQWQEDPLIQHDEVKLGGEFSIFYPDWSKEVSLPNNASDEVIYAKISEHMKTL